MSSKKCRKTASPCQPLRQYVMGCPKCYTHYSKKKFYILWNDILECKVCGNVWVGLSIEDLSSYL